MTTDRIIRKLCEAGHQIFIVGGFVRDELLGHTSKDIDITTSALPDEIIHLFRHERVNLVGKTFGVVIVNDVEVATFRSDFYGKPGKADVSLVGTIEEDLDRRDLTINALALCPLTGDIVDPHGGRDDLNNRVIRFVGNPVDRITEDPVRIIRACRFKAKIHGKFHPDTFKTLKAHANWIGKFVAPERIRLEILKGLELKKPSGFFRALDEIGALPFIFPSLKACVGFGGGDHHDETVFEHVCDAVDFIHPKHTPLRLATILHDVGKPLAWKDGQFLDHENVGAKIVRKELQRLRFSVDEVEFVTGLVKVHMNFMNGLTDRAARRLLKRLADNNTTFGDFVRIKLADRAGNRAKTLGTFADLIFLVRRFRALNNIPTNTNSLAINGNDIQELLGIGPGRQIGEIKDALLELVINNGSEFNNRETLTNHVLTVWG
jgi:tRNA nucleotidyltransferase (CCA-adding enzyme)